MLPHIFVSKEYPLHVFENLISANKFSIVNFFLFVVVVLFSAYIEPITQPYFFVLYISSALCFPFLPLISSFCQSSCRDTQSLHSCCHHSLPICGLALLPHQQGSEIRLAFTLYDCHLDISLFWLMKHD